MIHDQLDPVILSSANASATPMPELALLLMCCRVDVHNDDAAIRGLLTDSIDWRVFARKAVDHGIAPLVGNTLARVAPDIVPDEILDAFRANLEQTRRKNRGALDELE